ncbi:hypothetical protein PAXRUDRAFT_22242 [Paxillus rubicundulus Ve08.2h10]|uniref:HAT C-terminal dimerisation domain-containing protein n=1 Tax=Paxillus rubicundulus Ve08.2h10 TaxID=930991 RepID=A0A0D0C985_9AGAM|nr:hypothetical protein PAXRUDRAFT_22242 [Paxillus rubicundulus Ve08.2h10]
MGSELHADAIQHAEEIFKRCHLDMYGKDGNIASPKKKVSKISKLLQELSGDEGEEDEDDEIDNKSPWLKEFNLYLNSGHSCPPGMSIIQWWGINAQLYPVWASLARDHLSIMASSVSSE